MEADWEEVALIAHPGPGPNVHTSSVTTFAFDNSQELLWTGNQFGRVTSFYGAELQRYCSFKGHSSEPVKQLLFHDKGVLSISPRAVHFANRRGLTIWHLQLKEFTELRCMSFASSGNKELLIAGMQATMFRLEVEKGSVAQTLTASDEYVMMKRAKHYICAATGRGAVHIIDPTTLNTVKVWQAHLGLINDMDAKADYLVTCGWSPRQQHGLMLDPLSNVLSLKTLSPLPPIPFQPGAAFVRMHPRMSTTCILASQTGQLQVVDLHNPNTVNLKQVQIYEGTYLTTLELAPSGEALALADSLSQIHLWGSRSKLRFAEYSSPTVFANSAEHKQQLDWSPKSPLNSIGMPYYRDVLLSAWPSSFVFEVGAPPGKLDPDTTKRLKRAEMGYWAPNPKNVRRYQVEKTRLSERLATAIAAPKFLSEKARDAPSTQDDDMVMTKALETIVDTSSTGAARKLVPLIYRNVEIKYSKFGVDDFDFGFFNRTPFSGLENHITNSYINSLLQLFRFTPIVRNLALRHSATSCLFETCLLCELGFLIDMLEKADGRNCQATNFLRTFSRLPNAGPLNILEEVSSKTSLTNRIQTANRFLLDTFAVDFRRQAMPHHRVVDQLLAIHATATIRCAVCNQEQVRPESQYTHELVYPTKNLGPTGRMSRPSFSQILKQSVERQDVRGWCSRCNRYQGLSSRKHISSVATVLTINTAITDQDQKQLWCQPNWLPQEIGIIVQQGQFFCYEGQDLEMHIRRGVYEVKVYELIGCVVEVKDGEGQQAAHLVSMINVAPTSPNPEEPINWHLFNDFLVQPVPTSDALRFDISWKLPCVLTYQLKSASHHIDDSWKSALDTSILYRMVSAMQAEKPNEFRLLQPHERIGEGTHVGIDAEFVSLQREEIEIKADGKRETIRPSKMGLARVSVLREFNTPTTGPSYASAVDVSDGKIKDDPLLAGIPFIDDYITVSEPIVDYLTAYSGIQPGDLNPATSSRILVSLKTAYKKLWLLLNLGCIFVGHGLPKDFRTINIHVPRRQVIDTVDLFFLKSRQRKIGLRFLAGLLLGEEIQSGMHDSIEDARTALRLYDYWRDLVKQGEDEVERVLEWIYKVGYETEWRAVPLRQGPGGPIVLRPITNDGTPGRNTPEPATSTFVERSATATPVRKRLITTLSRPGSSGGFASPGRPAGGLLGP